MTALVNQSLPHGMLGVAAVTSSVLGFNVLYMRQLYEVDRFPAPFMKRSVFLALVVLATAIPLILVGSAAQ
jgi:hypothetical protein